MFSLGVLKCSNVAAVARLRCCILGVCVLFLSAIGTKAQAQLSITPITWDVIGLDSNNVNTGPNQYLVGVRVSNVGTTPASAVMAQFVWDSANASINLSGNSMVAVGELAPNAHADAFFNVVITRRTTARGAMRSYHITASATGLPTVRTPAGRRVYVEKLVSQNRNGVDRFYGPTTVILGQEYTYNVVSHTATQGYEPLAFVWI